MGKTVNRKYSTDDNDTDYFQKLVGVVTFLTKIQKSEGNSTALKNWIQKLEGKPTYYLEKLNLKNGWKFYYSQKLCFDNFSAWKKYNFLSGFLTNTILNFAPIFDFEMSR